jgi:hypothetical protein
MHGRRDFDFELCSLLASWMMTDSPQVNMSAATEITVSRTVQVSKV